MGDTKTEGRIPRASALPELPEPVLAEGEAKVTTSRERLICVMRALDVAYGKSYTEAQFLERLKVYEMGLDGCDMGDVERAARRCIQEERFPPTPSVLRGMAMPKPEAKALTAWCDVLEAIRRPSLRPRLLADPLIEKVIANLGGLEHLCMQESNDLLVWGRQRFVETFRLLDGGQWREDSRKLETGNRQLPHADLGVAKSG